ncbi:LCP family protein [Actinomyces ruminicola]|uniref:Transcriptional attenuator, LytR family n=1 Tax=Actinomyces ruminicola TaxID=332524 RepID=A0A1G9YBB2_9ACTO|nr:LCP family protein [Actinomyces ruminicola]SDN06372.1 transcriptional attenuator, LytR family [Actinomyces ruminicola]
MSDSEQRAGDGAPGKLNDDVLGGVGQTDSASRSSGKSRGGRRWRIALVSVLAVVLVLVAGTAVGGLWLRNRLSSNIETIGDPFASIATEDRAPEQEAEDPATNILVLGSDSRISAGDPDQWEAGAQRTDAIMLVQISHDREDVSVMSIPRDSWADIPGYGENKINAAFSYGGPSLTIQTVEQLTGVRIDHFVVADFESFSAITDAIGGVTINLKTAQTLAGTEFPAGAQLLNGQQALAYARERKSLPGGDFDRVNRQQAWMRAMVGAVLNNGILSNPTKLYSFLTTVTETLAVDEGFTIDEMQSLAMGLRGIHSTDINFMTVPTSGTGTSSDGQSIVILDAEADAPLFEAFQNGDVDAYLEENPDAVELLPATVN